MATFKVKHSHGTTERFDSYDDACEAVRAVYGADAVIGHDGDISDGGEKTLCWRSEDEATDDDGTRSCCAITKSHDA